MMEEDCSFRSISLVIFFFFFNFNFFSNSINFKVYMDDNRKQMCES